MEPRLPGVQPPQTTNAIHKTNYRLQVLCDERGMDVGEVRRKISADQ
jgi:hypothetical protein